VTDAERLVRALSPVERAARDLPWAKQRPWRGTTHVLVEGALPVVDLHDLGRRQAHRAVRIAAETAGVLDAGAVAVVTGRGRRSVGPGVLHAEAREVLADFCAEHGGYFRPAGPGRWVLVVDADRAPAAATGRLGWGCWFLVVAFATAALLALWRAF